MTQHTLKRCSPAYLCSCSTPISDPTWESWDGSCQRCGKIIDLTKIGDGDYQRPDVGMGSDPAFHGGQGREPEGLISDAAWLAGAALVAAAVVLWAVLSAGGAS